MSFALPPASPPPTSGGPVLTAGGFGDLVDGVRKIFSPPEARRNAATPYKTAGEALSVGETAVLDKGYGATVAVFKDKKENYYVSDVMTNNEAKHPVLGAAKAKSDIEQEILQPLTSVGGIVNGVEGPRSALQEELGFPPLPGGRGYKKPPAR